MSDVLREAPLGQFIRFASGSRFLKYPEELPGFVMPSHYMNGSKDTVEDRTVTAGVTQEKASDQSGSLTPQQTRNAGSGEELESVSMSRTKSRQYTTPYSLERAKTEKQIALDRSQSIAVIPQRTSDGIVLVDWYTTDDPANPHNWSSGKRAFITYLICAYTWVVYASSSIYAASEADVMKAFDVSAASAALPLALYVLAYGLGPLLWAPLCELPAIGRNPVYIATFVISFALSFGTAVVNDFGGLVALRFLQGYFGSPALANGGATFSDMYSLLYVPYQLS